MVKVRKTMGNMGKQFTPLIQSMVTMGKQSSPLISMVTIGKQSTPLVSMIQEKIFIILIPLSFIPFYNISIIQNS